MLPCNFAFHLWTAHPPNSISNTTTTKNDRHFSLRKLHSSQHSINMHIEVSVALNFVISYLYNKLPRRRVNIFGEELEKALKDKFQGHWYPEKPFKVCQPKMRTQNTWCAALICCFSDTASWYSIILLLFVCETHIHTYARSLIDAKHLLVVSLSWQMSSNSFIRNIQNSFHHDFNMAQSPYILMALLSIRNPVAFQLMGIEKLFTPTHAQRFLVVFHAVCCCCDAANLCKTSNYSTKLEPHDTNWMEHNL